MTYLLVSIIVNTILFIAISQFLPGFKIKTMPTAISVAAVYGLLGALLGLFLAVPIGFAIAALFKVLAFIPIVGPLLIGLIWLPLKLSAFVIGFAVSIVVLRATDHLIEDFEIDGWVTTINASALLGAGHVVSRFLLGM